MEKLEERLTTSKERRKEHQVLVVTLNSQKHLRLEILKLTVLAQHHVLDPLKLESSCLDQVSIILRKLMQFRTKELPELFLWGTNCKQLASWLQLWASIQVKPLAQQVTIFKRHLNSVMFRQQEVTSERKYNLVVF